MQAAWNNPYPSAERDVNRLYTSFAERPKTLDPARAYSSNEYAFIAQIYEPILQYHYLLRPYQLVPLTASVMPVITFLDKKRQPLLDAGSSDTKKVAFTRFTITLSPNTHFQPHPALAKSTDGKFYYHQLNKAYLESHHITHLRDFSHKGSRELLADDYIHQIKRLAHPRYNSPILGVMSEKIVGLRELNEALRTSYDKLLSLIHI